MCKVRCWRWLFGNKMPISLNRQPYTGAGAAVARQAGQGGGGRPAQVTPSHLVFLKSPPPHKLIFLKIFLTRPRGVGGAVRERGGTGWIARRWRLPHATTRCFAQPYIPQAVQPYVNPCPEPQTPNTKHQTPNTKHQTPKQAKIEALNCLLVCVYYWCVLLTIFTTGVSY